MQTSVILAGKCDSCRHSTASFCESVELKDKIYKVSWVVLFCGWEIAQAHSIKIMFRQIKASTSPPPPPGHTPSIWNLCRPAEEGIWLSESSRGWGIWTALLISHEISGMANNHGGCGVRGFSWKRLCLWGQLVTRKGLKQALCRIWRYLNFKTFNFGFKVLNIWMYWVAFTMKYNTYTSDSIQQ